MERDSRTAFVVMTASPEDIEMFKRVLDIKIYQSNFRQDGKEVISIVVEKDGQILLGKEAGQEMGSAIKRALRRLDK